MTGKDSCFQSFSGFSPKAALLVGPEDDRLREVHAQLTEAGYRILSAKTGEQALDLFQTCDTALQLLIADSDLPGLSGWDLAERISQLRPGVPVMFLPPSVSTRQNLQYDPAVFALLLRLTCKVGTRANAIGNREARVH